MKFSRAMMIGFVSSLAAACSTTADEPLAVSALKPCDVLVSIPTKPATNTYLRNNDRAAFVGLGRHAGRVDRYGCEVKEDGR